MDRNPWRCATVTRPREASTTSLSAERPRIYLPRVPERLEAVAWTRSGPTSSGRGRVAHPVTGDWPDGLKRTVVRPCHAPTRPTRPIASTRAEQSHRSNRPYFVVVLE